jgi:hypothetical protein
MERRAEHSGMADGAVTVVVELDEQRASEMRAEAVALGMSLEELVQLRVSYPSWYWSDDPASTLDEQIADETLRRREGVSLEAFAERMKTFGRRPA